MTGKKQILVTGATGLVGSAVVKALRAEGHAITTVSRRPASASANTANPNTITWDELASLSGMPPLDAVIHLAGEPIFGVWTAARKRRIRESRVETTRQLSSILAELKPRPGVLLCASAIGYYGSRGHEILPESSGPGSGFLAEVCVEWENAADLARQAGIRVVHLRIGMVLSRDGGALREMLPLFRIGLGGRIGSGEQWMSWIEIGDLVRIVQRSLSDDSLVGPINSVAPNPVANSEFTRTLGKVLHRPTLLPVPPIVLKMLPGGMSKEVMLASARVVPEKLVNHGFRFEHPELSEALGSLLPVA